MLLLHGFPLFWYTWRRQLESLADEGFRVVAMDLRGYAGSDHPPQGYDPMTGCADVAGVIRSLGEAEAVVVGHGWGGLLAWTLPVLQPQVVSRVAVVSMPHPRAVREGLLWNPRQLSAGRKVLGWQWPLIPERRAAADGARRIGEQLHHWSATPSWPDPETEEIYRAAMLVPHSPHCAYEYYRWAVRSAMRPDGLRYARAMGTRVAVPVLQVHGADDPVVMVGGARSSRDWTSGPYALRVLDGVGHFPQEEAPALFDDLLRRWLTAPEPWNDPA